MLITNKERNEHGEAEAEKEARNAREKDGFASGRPWNWATSGASVTCIRENFIGENLI